MTLLVPFLLGLMAQWSPPPTLGDAARYEAIAEDIADVSEEAPLFEGAHAVERTAVMLAAVASLESFYRADVDAFQTRGDHGLAWGLLQVHLLPGEQCRTRLECLRIGRERVRL